MTQKIYPQAYFDHKAQQARLKSAILGALPDDGSIYYHNLIIALSELLADFSQQAFKEEVYGEKESTLTYQQKPVKEWLRPEEGEK
jgi:hypothetical protein